MPYNAQLMIWSGHAESFGRTPDILDPESTLPDHPLAE